MPLAFVREITNADILDLNVSPNEEAKFLEYVKQTYSETENDPKNKYAFALSLDVRFRKSKTDKNVAIQIVHNDPTAMKVELSDEQVHSHFPYTYHPLREICSERYSDFKQSIFNDKIKLFKQSSKLSYERRLDPKNPRTSKQYRYASGVLEELDKIFTRAAQKKRVAN